MNILIGMFGTLIILSLLFILLISPFIIIIFLIKNRYRNNNYNPYNNPNLNKSYDRNNVNNEMNNQPSILPYFSKHMLTKTEYNFYLILRSITDKYNCIICPKVGLKDIANINDRKNYMKWFGKISQKHVDFLVCDEGLNILFAIELDDWTHNTRESIKNDNFKNSFYLSIGIPLKRIKVGSTYNNLEEFLFPNFNYQNANNNVNPNQNIC